MDYHYDGFVYAIAFLLPISAAILVSESNPYHALVIRGILGAVSALVYTVLGAADVALTEALVGAFLATMLYVVAVRSSLVLRLGVMKEIAIAQELEQEFQPLNDLDKLERQNPSALDNTESIELNLNKAVLPPEELSESAAAKVAPLSKSAQVAQIVAALQNAFSRHYMRVELVPFENDADLEKALVDKVVHGIMLVQDDRDRSQIKIRLRRLHEIMQTDPQLANMQIIYTN
ncbi:MAG: hydrogenase subunit MbhD domain-containing protein [Pseudanabaenaceae cyanobacterium bins.39]|nr:hydrogenase subunit MbhD domain-containing protein [Pseudanabaenaceae cyanobacterium bins.39]